MVLLMVSAALWVCKRSCSAASWRSVFWYRRMQNRPNASMQRSTAGKISASRLLRSGQRAMRHSFMRVPSCGIA